jgi:hypothetical protein
MTFTRQTHKTETSLWSRSSCENGVCCKNFINSNKRQSERHVLHEPRSSLHRNVFNIAKQLAALIVAAGIHYTECSFKIDSLVKALR